VTRWLPRFGPPPDVSLDGHRADGLIAVLAALSGACLLLVTAALCVLLVRYRARPGRRARYAHGRERGPTLLVLALAGFVLVGIDAQVVRASRADLREHLGAFPHGADVVRVEVLAQQFAWSFRYAGADGRFGTEDDVVSLDELRVPVGAPVVLAMAARDVVHSFFVPALRAKQDVIPGRLTRTWFQVTRAGRYDVVCAQLCGFGHGQMRAALVAQDRAGFARWLADAGADARRAYAPADADAHWAWEWRE
jgi:cytochrome c oxidase subunit 2